MSAPIQRHSVLDALRGLAALGVAWFHFTNGNPSFLSPGFVKNSGALGWLGVEVFFVISGFIIPFVLDRGGYRIGDYGIFLLKRIVRLDPPYVVSIAIVIILALASSMAPNFQGVPFHFSLPQLLLHFGYINVFFGYPWFNPVFWSLAIELQYYLLIGLVFPFLNSKAPVCRYGTMAMLAVTSFVVPETQFVPYWLVLFLFGIVTFHKQKGLINGLQYLFVLSVVSVLSLARYGYLITFVAFATALTIAFLRVSHRHPLVFFGHISYSLYLIHAPIGGRIVNLGNRYVHAGAGEAVVLMLALGGSICAAWLLHRWVERPAQAWSASIKYRRKVIAPSGFGPRNY
jgi:peptidoglycan/LPS O-acetylase OafA/YrhL